MLHDAVMITADADRGAAIRFETTVELLQPAGNIVRASLAATAHGIYECEVNGQPVTASVLNPGWTSYEWRLQVQEYDIVGLLSDVTGSVAVAGTVGNGWWRGDLGFDGALANYGAEIGFIAEVTITYADGTVQTTGTTPSWTASPTDTIENNLYRGQTIDARKRGQPADPLPVRTTELARQTLVPQTGPLILRHESVKPVALLDTPSGRTVVDFGQNLVGWTRLSVTGQAGAVVTVRHAEVLEHGELGTRPLRAATATDTYILSGGNDNFEPSFTFHGFRYAEITGIERADLLNSVEAVVVHSDIPRTGWFESSHEGLNQLVHNSVWSQRGNFLDLPMDCPQRDERLGWTGDIAVFAPTAAFQFDVADFLHKWLLDVENEARDHGAVPLFVPQLHKYAQVASPWDQGPSRPFAIWSDAAVWVPHALWEAYGDASRLAQHYPLMVLHLESVEPRLAEDGVWEGEFQLGDWLDPDAAPDRPADAKADPVVVATAALYRSLVFAAEAADVLGIPEDHARWADLAARVRRGFNSRFVADDGTVTSDCATVYALAIVFDLLDVDKRALAGDRLAAIVAATDYRVTTGFAGTPYVTWALSETGHSEAAYRLVLDEDMPSWLYPVAMGATTIWERWDSMLPDGSINPGDMTSFNHYALGAVVDWLYKVVAGIQATSAGYGSVRLAPTPGPGLDWARAGLETRHGRIECGWQRIPDGFEITARIPEGIAGELVLPYGRVIPLSAGAHSFIC